MVMWSILQLLCIFCGHLVIFSRFGILHQYKSGNPVFDSNGNFVIFISCEFIVDNVCQLHYFVNQTDRNVVSYFRRDSISRPVIPQAETIPLDHAAGYAVS
jgi:hypothetical protein